MSNKRAHAPFTIDLPCSSHARARALLLQLVEGLLRLRHPQAVARQVIGGVPLHTAKVVAEGFDDGAEDAHAFTPLLPGGGGRAWGVVCATVARGYVQEFYPRKQTRGRPPSGARPFVLKPWFFLGQLADFPILPATQLYSFAPAARQPREGQGQNNARIHQRSASDTAGRPPSRARTSIAACNRA